MIGDYDEHKKTSLKPVSQRPAEHFHWNGGLQTANSKMSKRLQNY